jgi:hypothetical protein
MPAEIFAFHDAVCSLSCFEVTPIATLCAPRLTVFDASKICFRVVSMSFCNTVVRSRSWSASRWSGFRSAYERGSASLARVASALSLRPVLSADLSARSWIPRKSRRRSSISAICCCRNSPGRSVYLSCRLTSQRRACSLFTASVVAVQPDAMKVLKMYAWLGAAAMAGAALWGALNNDD